MLSTGVGFRSVTTTPVTNLSARRNGPHFSKAQVRGARTRSWESVESPVLIFKAGEPVSALLDCISRNRKVFSRIECVAKRSIWTP